MKKNRDRVTNVTPFDVQVKVNQAGFELWFYTAIGNDCTRKHIVKIKLEQWWLKHIAECLWTVIKKRRSEVEEMELGMQEQ